MKSKRFKLLIILLLSIQTLFLGNSVYAINQEVDSSIKVVQNGSYFSFTPKTKMPTQKPKVATTQVNLPAKYDLRNINGKSYVNPPEFQNPWGCCWAFGALSAAESNALLDGEQSVNFSKRALTYYGFQKQGTKGSPTSDYEGVYYTSDSDLNSKLCFNGGGDYNLAISQMASGNGNSTTKDIPYQNDQGILVSNPHFSGITEYSPEGTWSLPYQDIYNDAFRVLGNTNIKTNNDYSEDWVDEYTNQAKRIMMEDGALFLGFFMGDGTDYFNDSTYAQYVSKPEIADHAVSIVGWDDSYPIENFNSKNKPSKPGAWICKNNWSTGWGDNGYFYLSYYDQTITDLGSFDIEVPENGNYSYDSINQYDYLGNKDNLSYAENQILLSRNYSNNINPNYKVANVFISENESMLKAVSAQTYFPNAQINVSVYLLGENSYFPDEGQLVQQQTEEILIPGFNTFELEAPIYLSEGQKYSIVESILYEDIEMPNGDTVDLYGLPIEFGLSDPLPLDINMGSLDESVKANYNFDVNISPGTSFVYDIAEGEPYWADLNSIVAQQELGINMNDQGYGNKTTVPGNAMIKTYTSELEESYTPATQITVNNNDQYIYLSTLPNATNSIELNATVSPANADNSVVWVNENDSVATLSNVTGNTTTVTAKGVGFSTITVNAGKVSTTLVVSVNNDPVTCGDFLVTGNTPDNYSVIVKNVIPNPAIGEIGDIAKVSIFNWSEVGSDGVQTDMNAKVAKQIPGTNDWQWDNFPVNNNAVNNYFIDAEDIQINIYASKDLNNEGNLVGVLTWSWMNLETAQNADIGYIGYSQNLGFVHPTVFDGQTAGTTGRNLNLEGFRISPNIMNLNVNTRVHVQNLGWMDPVGNGVYAGTMHRNLGIEAIELSLSGSSAEFYEIEYRVHQKNFGWQNWVSAGQTAGSIGQNNQIEAIEVRLIQKY